MVRAFAIALLVAGLSAASAVVSGPVRAQTPGAEVEPKPIGKVVSAGGSVTIEHATAVVVQAAAGGSGQAKVGDFVYQGDLVQTGADSAVGIAFTDGTAFNVASNARIVLNEFVYHPKGRPNSTLLGADF